MRRLICALMVLFMSASFPARADPYQLGNATWLRKVCVDDEDGILACWTYLGAIADVYFLLQPNCPRPDQGFALNALTQKVGEKTRSMTVAQLAGTSSAGVIYSAIIELNPCPAPAKPSLNFEKHCRKLWEGLASDLLDSFAKQAMLETLRNRGCLK